MRRLSLVVLLSALCVSAAEAERTKALGVVDYFATYEATTERRRKSYDKVVKGFFKDLKSLGANPEWVAVDIFLPANKAKRDAYKRILIPPTADWFTQEMYDGMFDYVKSGGLLITQVSCVLVDLNGNYKPDEGTTTKFAANTFLGVRGTGGTGMPEVKVVAESPLTKGLPKDTWIKLAKPTAGRRTYNRGATVVMVSKQDRKGKAFEGPFVSYKKAAKGACIYISGYCNRPEDPTLTQVLKNAISDETLAALCVP